MFLETDAIKLARVKQLQTELLELNNISHSDFLKYFKNYQASRLTKAGFELVNKQFTFHEIDIEAKCFTMKDIVHLSKLLCEYFYIDSRKTKIYTTDTTFRDWCMVLNKDISAIRIK